MDGVRAVDLLGGRILRLVRLAEGRRSSSRGRAWADPPAFLQDVDGLARAHHDLVADPERPLAKAWIAASTRSFPE